MKTFNFFVQTQVSINGNIQEMPMTYETRQTDNPEEYMLELSNLRTLESSHMDGVVNVSYQEVNMEEPPATLIPFEEFDEKLYMNAIYGKRSISLSGKVPLTKEAYIEKYGLEMFEDQFSGNQFGMYFEQPFEVSPVSAYPNGMLLHGSGYTDTDGGVDE